MTAMETATRSHRVSDLRRQTTPAERLERRLDVEGLSACAAMLGLFEHEREHRALSKAELGRKVDIQRTVISRLLSADGDPNPTVQTLVRLLYGLGLHADITVRHREPGEARVLEVTDERAVRD